MKKRSKKLLSVAGSPRASGSSELPDEICKSFLLLFFKKEESSFSGNDRPEFGVTVGMKLRILLLIALAASAPAHRHRRVHHIRHATAPAAAAQPVAQKPDPTAPTPAPVPNEDVSPPKAPLPPNTASLVPGNLQLHFPSLGDGYLPGSSSSDVSNITQPNVPGVSIVVPLSAPSKTTDSDQPAP